MKEKEDKSSSGMTEAKRCEVVVDGEGRANGTSAISRRVERKRMRFLWSKALMSVEGGNIKFCNV